MSINAAAFFRPAGGHSVAVMAMFMSFHWLGCTLHYASAAVVNIADVSPLLTASQMAALNRGSRTWSVYSETAIMMPSGGIKYVGGTYAPNAQKLIFAPYGSQYFGVVDPRWNTSAYSAIPAPHSANYGYLGGAYCPLNGYVYTAPYLASEGVRYCNPVNNASWAVSGSPGGYVDVVYADVIQKLVFCPYSGSAMVLDPRTNAWAQPFTGLGGNYYGIA